MTATILQRIVATKRREVDAARAIRPVAEVAAAATSAPAPRDFFGAIALAGAPIRLIAEIKKASPSAGLIRTDFDPVSIARIYEGCGASALSVLTDQTYFQGELGFIQTIKQAVKIPILRKDFLIDEYQIHESRAAGADAVLLIAAILSKAEIERFSELAFRLGMASLIEVHAAAELEQVAELIGPARRSLLGINNRDLSSQQIDLATTVSLSQQCPSRAAFVAESGLKTRADVEAMQRLGASGVLIGETFMRAPDIAAKVRELMNDCVR